MGEWDKGKKELTERQKITTELIEKQVSRTKRNRRAPLNPSFYDIIFFKGFMVDKGNIFHFDC